MAAIVAAILAVDPAGLGGVSVKAGPGPVRDAWLTRLRELVPESAPIRRMPVNISDSGLLGGLDLAATLQMGRPVAQRGILAGADGGILIVPMAERLEPGTVARLGAILDAGEIQVERDGLGLRVTARCGVVALDEGAGDDETPHPALLDRLAFLIDLDQVSPRDVDESDITRDAIAAAKARLDAIGIDETVLRALCGTAMALGISSFRASLLALRAARAIAALAGHAQILAEDATLAAKLVLAPRATRIPAPEQTEPEQTEPEQPEPEQSDDSSPDAEQARSPDDQAGNPDDENESSGQPLDDIVLAAAEAAIPAGLLARLRTHDTSQGRSKAAGKTGLPRTATLHGRPAGVRKGDLRDGVRLDLLETLRAAAPFQRLRREAMGRTDPRRLEIRRDDFRLPRLKQRSETVSIFVVDASGSSALNRLAEAKGAVELLLAECYVRRDKVALVAFRGKGAELLLPPTRSLVRAKRCLANLPGGGGTPLASGIEAATALAEGVRRQGATPVVILMTDGRANVARAGAPGRIQAGIDARAAGRKIQAAGIAALLVDTSPRGQDLARELATEMDAIYLPLPPGGAAALSRSIQAVSPARGDRRVS